VISDPTPSFSDQEDSDTMPAETNSGPGGGGAPRASLICRPNSHPFQDRMLSLDQPVKVGRSVARARPVQTNAIFDCKVLSRNHALLWYENGKFYLQDTKSSNGTFVNNQRLSKGSEESPPREVCSGDILQFGVDVMENSRKVTHGCIIATLKLYLPDGKEAKASPSIVNTSVGGTSIPAQDLYQLNQYIQEALAREQLLETKLVSLQRLVGDTEIASNQGWKALMDEDRLLTRVEILESQLTTYGKSMNEDKLREETKRLMEEKESYQNTAKDTLKRLVDDKLESCKKLKDVETLLGNLEAEYTSLKQLYDKAMEENRKLSEKVTSISEELIKKTKDETSEMNDLNDSQTELKKSELYIKNDVFGENGSNTNGKYCEDDSDLDKTEHDSSMQGSTDSLDGTKPDDEDDDCDDDHLELMKDEEVARLVDVEVRLRRQMEDLQQAKVKTDHELVNLRINLEEAKNENATILQELEKTRTKLSETDLLIGSQDQLVRDLKIKVETGNSSSSNKQTEELLAAVDNIKIVPDQSSAIEIVKDDQCNISPVASADSSLSSSLNEGSEEFNKLRNLVESLGQTNKAMQAKLSEKEQELSICRLAVSRQEKVMIHDMGPPLASSPMKEDGQILSSSLGSQVVDLSSSLPVSTTRESLNQSSSSATSDVSVLEQSLEEAETKIAGLLKMKEKLVIVQGEKSQLELDVSTLEEDLSTMSAVSRTLTACTMGPLLVMLIAVVVAFFPVFSSILGTRDF